MKKLIYEFSERIEARKKYAADLLTSLNLVLTRFQSTHNHFGQPLNENFAFQLVSQPVETFDELLRANSPIKPIAGKQLDIDKLAELCSIDRAGFIAAFTVTLPGSVDNYNRAGRTGVLKLADRDKHLVSWSKDHFTLNAQALAAELELHRVYCENDEQLKELQWWEDLAAMLNEAKERKIISDSYGCNEIARHLKILYEKKERRFGPEMFRVDYKTLAGIIKNMVTVN